MLRRKWSIINISLLTLYLHRTSWQVKTPTNSRYSNWISSSWDWKPSTHTLSPSRSLVERLSPSLQSSNQLSLLRKLQPSPNQLSNLSWRRLCLSLKIIMNQQLKIIPTSNTVWLKLPPISRTPIKWRSKGLPNSKERRNSDLWIWLRLYSRNKAAKALASRITSLLSSIYCRSRRANLPWKTKGQTGMRCMIKNPINPK